MPKLALSPLVCILFLLFVSSVFAEEKKEDPAAAAVAIPSEFMCEADIFYSWQRLPEPVRKDARGEPIESNQSAELFKPIEVFFSKAIARAPVREEAEKNVKSTLTEFEANARRACETEHQNQGSCSASRLRNFEADMRKMDFDSRHALIEQITADCAKNTGICVSTKASEVACREFKPDQKEAEVPAADAGKKPPDKKKK